MAIRAPSLPQNDDHPEFRRNHLNHKRSQYQYIYEYFSNIANVDGVPKQEEADLRYNIAMLKNLAFGFITSFVPLVKRYVWFKLLKRPFKEDMDYFFFANSPVPDENFLSTYKTDESFALQRVMGMNPVVLQGVTPENPLPENLHYSELKRRFPEVISDMSLQEAKEKERLFFVDYAMLQSMEDNPGVVDGVQQYVTAPIAVFYLKDDGLLTPVAIQLRQTLALEKNPVFIPTDGEHWEVAKTFVQAADGDLHEYYTHATRVHYLIEALVLGTRRNLAFNHPINVLLTPHFQYTIQLNHNHTFLKDAKGVPGAFGALMGGDYDSSMRCMATGLSSFNFHDMSLPNDLKNRAVDNPDLFYPYRDDGQKSWDAIQKFALAYCEHYYENDEAVINDHELQAWGAEIHSQKEGGRIHGFPQSFDTVKKVAKTVGHIIFIATAHHAAIHYSQYQYAGFVPNMPFSSYVPAPTSLDIPIKEENRIKMLPPYQPAWTQTFTFYLTNVKVNRMGQYDMEDFEKAIHPTIKVFQDDLAKIAAEIDKENETRPYPYHYMNPKTVTNSVTV